MAERVRPAGDVGHKASHRVNRGGAWNNSARNCRAAYRNANHPSNEWHNLGFRLARALRRAGWRAMDPAGVATAASRCGKQQAGPGVEVGVAERRSNPRRWPSLPLGER